MVDRCSAVYLRDNLALSRRINHKFLNRAKRVDSSERFSLIRNLDRLSLPPPLYEYTEAPRVLPRSFDDEFDGAKA